MAITTDAAILDLLKSLDPKDKDLLLRKANMLVPETRDKVSGIISTLENKIESLREDLVWIGEEAFDIKEAIKSAKPETPGNYVIFTRTNKTELNISVALHNGDRGYSQGSGCWEGDIGGEDESCFLQFEKYKLLSNLSRYIDGYGGICGSYLPVFLNEYDIVLEAEAKLKDSPEIIDRIRVLKGKTQAACELLDEIIESATYARANSIDWPLLDQYKIHLPFLDEDYGSISTSDLISFSLVVDYNKEKNRYETRYDYWVSSSYRC